MVGDPIWETYQVIPEEPERQPRELVADMLGFSRAQGHALHHGGPLLEELPDVVQDLPRLRDSGLLDIEHPSRLVIKASDPELETARLLAVGLADALRSFVRAVEVREGRDAAGLGIVTALEWRWLRLWLLRLALALPALGGSEGLRELARALEQAEPQAATLVAITEAFPGYRQFLVPGGDRRLAALPEEELANIRHNLETFFEEHPEYAQAVGLHE